MAKFVFWQRKEVIAKNISEAIKKENKAKYKFHSIDTAEDESENELTSCIGFTIDRGE